VEFLPFKVKILGRPIGAMAEFDGDNDGKITGPTGEDIVPYFKPDPNKPGFDTPSTSPSLSPSTSAAAGAPDALDAPGTGDTETAEGEIDTSPDGLLADPDFDVGDTLADAIYVMFGDKAEQESARLGEDAGETEVGKLIRLHARTLQRYMRRGIDPRTEEGARRAILELAPQLADSDTEIDGSRVLPNLPGAKSMLQVYPTLPPGTNKQTIADIGRVLHLIAALNGDVEGHDAGFLKRNLRVLTIHDGTESDGLGGVVPQGIYSALGSMTFKKRPQMMGLFSVLSFHPKYGKRAKDYAKNPKKPWKRRGHDQRAVPFAYGGQPLTVQSLAAAGLTANDWRDIESRTDTVSSMITAEMKGQYWPQSTIEHIAGVALSDHELVHPQHNTSMYAQNLGIPVEPVDLTTPEGQEAMYNAVFMHYRMREILRALKNGRKPPSEEKIKDAWNSSLIRETLLAGLEMSPHEWQASRGLSDDEFEKKLRENFGEEYLDSVGVENVPISVINMITARLLMTQLGHISLDEPESGLIANPFAPVLMLNGRPTSIFLAATAFNWGTGPGLYRGEILDEYTDEDYAALFAQIPELSPDGKGRYLAQGLLTSMYGSSKANEFAAEGLSLARLMPSLQVPPKNVMLGVLPPNLKMLLPRLQAWIEGVLSGQKSVPGKPALDAKLKAKQLIAGLFMRTKQMSATDVNWDLLSGEVADTGSNIFERFVVSPSGGIRPFFPPDGCSGHRPMDSVTPEMREAVEDADMEALEKQYLEEFNQRSGLAAARQEIIAMNKARDSYAPQQFKQHLDGMCTKILGAPIGGMAEFDGDNDGFVTGPTGEDIVPFTQKPIVQKPEVDTREVEQSWRDLLPEFVKNSWFGQLFNEGRSTDAPVLEAVNDIIKSHARLRKRYEEKYGDMLKWDNAQRALKDMFPNLAVESPFEQQILRRANPSRRINALDNMYEDRATGNDDPSPLQVGLVLSILQEGENMTPQQREVVVSIEFEDDPFGNSQGSYSIGSHLYGDSRGIAGGFTFSKYLDIAINKVIDRGSNTTKREDVSVDDLRRDRNAQFFVSERIVEAMQKAGYSRDAIGYIVATELVGHEFGHARHFSKILDELGVGERIKVEEPGSIQKMRDSIMQLATARRQFSREAFGFDPWSQTGASSMDSTDPMQAFDAAIDKTKQEWRDLVARRNGSPPAIDALRFFGHPVLDKYSPDNIPEEWFAANAYAELFAYLYHHDPRPKNLRPAPTGRNPGYTRALDTGRWAWYYRAEGETLDGSIVDAMLGATDSMLGGKITTPAQDDLTEAEYTALMDGAVGSLGRGGNAYLLSSTYGTMDFSEFIPEMAMLRRFRLLDEDALRKTLREAAVAAEKIWDWLDLARIDQDMKTKQDEMTMPEKDEDLVYGPPVTQYDIVDGKIYGSTRKVCSGHTRPSVKKSDARQMLAESLLDDRDTSRNIRKMDAAIRLMQIRKMNGEKSAETERLVNSANFAVRDFYYVRSNSMKVKEASPYTNPALRERIKDRIMAGSQGGRPGQWSARKAQLLAARYRAAGGGYKKGKRPTRAQRSLKKWTREKWRTSDGKPALRNGRMRRYLPDKVWGRLTRAQRDATNRKKIQGDKRGQQFVPNTRAAAKKSRTVRKSTGK